MIVVRLHVSLPPHLSQAMAWILAVGHALNQEWVQRSK
jgi:hypothetical protein